jgi:hypothetical protein
MKALLRLCYRDRVEEAGGGGSIKALLSIKAL